MSITNHSVLATLFVASSLAAQDTWNLPANCKGPVGVTWIGNDHVAISTLKSGKFHLVKDNGSGNAPTPTKSCLDPAYGDQWFEGEYTKAFGGRYVVAHRYGGINLIDVSDPSATSFGDVLHSRKDAKSKYHFKGKRFLTVGNNHYLLYNEHNVSNLGGGLVVYPITTSGAPTGNRLSVCYDNLTKGTDANGLAVIGRNAFQLGWENNNKSTRYLRTYDMSVPCKPKLCSKLNIPVVVSYSHNDMEECPLGPRILVTMNYDGLKCIDVKNPCKPVVHTIFPPNKDIYWRGCEYFPNSPFAIAWGQVRVGTSWQHYWIFVYAPPTGACQILSVMPAPIQTIDIAMKPDGSRVYVVGNQANGSSQLLVY